MPSPGPAAFHELIDGARALSQLIQDAGVEPGGRVGMLMPNDRHFQDAARLCDVIAHGRMRAVKIFRITPALVRVTKKAPARWRVCNLLKSK